MGAVRNGLFDNVDKSIHGGGVPLPLPGTPAFLPMAIGIEVYVVAASVVALDRRNPDSNPFCSPPSG